MFITMRYINKIKPKTLLSVKHKNQYNENEKKQTRILANYVKKQLKRQTITFRSTNNTNEKNVFKRRYFPGSH